MEIEHGDEIAVIGNDASNGEKHMKTLTVKRVTTYDIVAQKGNDNYLFGKQSKELKSFHSGTKQSIFFSAEVYKITNRELTTREQEALPEEISTSNVTIAENESNKILLLKNASPPFLEWNGNTWKITQTWENEITLHS